MMCNKCGCENITTAYICVNCGNDCQPERTNTGTIKETSSIDRDEEYFEQYGKYQDIHS